MARLRELAEHHRVSAPLLATRKDIEALVLGHRDLPLLQGWRRELAGEELLGMLGAA
jgi:ribonuclease D